jgi:putative colanic acid biosynthesis acetyltransferase WcaF
LNSTKTLQTSERKVDLNIYDNSWYSPKAGRIKQTLWYFVNALFFINPLNPFSGIKVFLLKLFGAKLGRKVLIKPAVSVKYPWLLEIGDHSWVGEQVWIDNLVKVKIGRNCCLSQGAFLLTGNHNYKTETFDLMVGEITLEDGVWIGAKSIVGPGILCKSHSVLSVNSVASSDLEPYQIYRGNPAVPVKQRIINAL